MRFSKALPLCILSSSTFLLVGCAPPAVTLIAPNGDRQVTIPVEVADDPEARLQGLMWREALPENTGMLFAFKEPQSLTFWMKNTKIPLEIMFFDGDGTFVNSFLMPPCTGDPCDKYTSASLAQYALEMSPGFRTTNGIGVGWKLDMKGVRRVARPK